MRMFPILAQAATTLWILTILCLLVCAGLGYFGWKLLERVRHLSKRLGALESAARQRSTGNPDSGRVASDSGRVASDLGRVKADVQTLQRRISILEKGPTTTPPATPPRPPRNAPPAPRNQPPALATRPQEEGVFYMAFPINNYFLDKGKSLSRDNMVYRFKVNGDGNEATFSVTVAGPQLPDIMKRVETFLRPACQEDNLPGSMVKAIQTREPGVAVLQGDKWLIKTKAVIRYE
jgi:hypothetical protein